MTLFSNKIPQLDDLLDKMAESLQLDDTRYDRMKQTYEAVKNWIESDETFFKPYKYDVYPHGSVRTLTTVKPYKKDEFDLDVALQLTNDTPHTPDRIYKELKRRLEESERYKAIMQLKNRCIRLDYSGDYHMDILPGIQQEYWDKDKIRIPDRELGHWVSSNPRGYANWFLDKANTVTSSILEKALRAENLPTDNFKYKKPLQRAVQLIKRYRDIYFNDNDEFRTSSIILTTIAGQYYNGEESIFETVENIVNSIEKHIGNPQQRLKVLNPVNKDEDFTDKWDSEPNYYEEFKKFAKHLRSEWEKLKRENGIINEGIILKGLFGDDLFVNAQKQQALIVEELRKNSQLNISGISGTLGLNTNLQKATPVKSNTFFGN